TTRFCGYMFVLSPLVYPQWASSRRQLTTGEAVVCGLREALGVIGIGLHSILRTEVSRLPFSSRSLHNNCTQCSGIFPAEIWTTFFNCRGFFHYL
ncbi:hypothetical protein B0H14DRAFT_2844354, partial [Mycena olivaceomarginata]